MLEKKTAAKQKKQASNANMASKNKKQIEYLNRQRLLVQHIKNLQIKYHSMTTDDNCNSKCLNLETSSRNAYN